MLLSRAALLLLVPTALLVARVTGGSCLQDLATPCSIDPPPTEVVLFDSWLYNFETPFWSFDLPWIVSNTTMCRQQLQFTGNDTTETATSANICYTKTEAPEVTFSAYFDFNVSSCTNQMLIVRELGKTEAILSIPCDAASPQSIQTATLDDIGFSIEILVEGDYGAEDSVTVERLQVVSTVCEEMTRDNVEYPQTPANDTATVSCVDNSSPDGGSLTLASCRPDGSWDISQNCLCDPGFGGSDGMGCTGCMANTYKINTGNEECLPCPANSMSAPNSTECMCNTGYTRMDGADISANCSECVADYYLNGSNMCQPCPAGSSSSGSVSFCTCDDGRATPGGSPMTTGEECSGCVVGYYRNGNVCIRCPVGSNSSDPVSTSCTCGPGRVTAGGENTTTVEVCSHCVANHFMMSDSCMSCPGGSTSPGEDVETCTCQDNTADQSGEAETTTNCNGCVAGYYRDGSVCIQCPVGSNSSDPLSTSCTCDTGKTTSGGENTTTVDECSDCAEGLSILDLNCVPTVSFAVASIVVQEASSTRFDLTISVSPSEDVTVELEATGYSGGDITIDPVTFSANGGTTESFIVLVPDDMIALEMNEEINITLTSRDNNVNVGDPLQLTVEDDDVVVVSFSSNTISVNESMGLLTLTLMISHEIAEDLEVMVTVTNSNSPRTQSLAVTFSKNGDRTATLNVDVNDNVAGNVVLTVRIEPSDMFQIDSSGNGEAMVMVMDDGLDEEESGGDGGLSSGVIIGIIVGAVGLGILVLLITLVLVIICRFQVNRQGFYHTDEDKTVAPSMLRYSASLRSISSQTVMPADGRSTIKENEFYV